MKRDLWEILQDDDRLLSSGRVAYVGSFIAASLIMGGLLYVGKMTENYFLIYTGTFALGHVGGKMAGRGQNGAGNSKRR